MVNTRTRLTKQFALLAVLFSLMFFAGTSALAQAPAAGTSIGNQASALYTDASSIQRTATSNAVITTVQQVGSLTLLSSNGKTGAPGSQVVYSHTLTNTGNGPDSFTLATATSGAFTMTNIAIFADANGDGAPDNATNLVGTNVAVAPGAIYQFLVIGTVPVSATIATSGAIAVTAKSVLDATQLATNTDTTSVSANAIVNVTKSISSPSGAAGSGPYTVTLNYTNNGGSAASAVTLTDAIPAGMTYVAGSARWSVTGAATVLTDGVDAAQGTGPTILYSMAGSTVTAVINTVPTTVSGTLTFSVNINSGLAPGVLNNTATIGYNDGSALVGPFNTNTATFTVRQSAALTISAGTTVAAATQGATVSFTSLVTNTGNGSDVFNIALSGSTFPTGTTFSLLKSDGVTPLMDSNTDGIPDSGPIAAAASVNVVIHAVLPPASVGGPYTVVVTATSTVAGAINAGANASATDTLTTITASLVDLTINAPVGGSSPLGVGAGPEGAAVSSNTTAPGFSTTFLLYANNTAGSADSYNVLASSTTTLPGILPSGWSVQFRGSTGSTGGVCAAANLGSGISDTPVVNSGTNTPICATITVPANFAAGTYPIYFETISESTGALDKIHAAIVVSIVHAVALTPNQSGQVYPGGSVVYNHTLTNNGNVTESITFPAGWVADGTAGFASVFYQDNGGIANSIDATDSPVTLATTFNLAPGVSVVMLTKVTAPSGAAVGAVDTTTLTATYNSGASSSVATDSSTVITGQLRLTKLQVLDPTCIGTLSAFAATPIAAAKPGACVIYQITAVNQGTTAISTVSVDDATPSNTTYTLNSGHPATTSKGTITAPTAGTTGSVVATVGAMNPNDTAVITFSVKINQ